MHQFSVNPITACPPARHPGAAIRGQVP